MYWLHFLSTEAEKVAFLLGINAGDLLKSLLKPKIKVGSEYVTQGRNMDQVSLTRPLTSPFHRQADIHQTNIQADKRTA